MLFSSKLLLLGGLASRLVAALPSSPEGSTEPDACCCCDIGIGAISCTTAIPADQCICAAVVCPPGASTVWPDATPEPTVSTPTLPEPPVITDDTIESSCCCCDVTGDEPVIACRPAPLNGVCICTLIACPDNAPTVFPEALPIATPQPLPEPQVDPVPLPEPQVDPVPLPEPQLESRAEKPCCCCDLSIPAISCKMQPEEDSCNCTKVLCPKDAPTVWPFGGGHAA